MSAFYPSLTLGVKLCDIKKGLPVVKTIYTYGFHELFLKYSIDLKMRKYWNKKMLFDILANYNNNPQ